MDYNIKAIETEYKGYKFRSRLEARWAVFFDLLGWQWEYEPVDFNGWIPDFVIYGKDKIYVEVKPVVEFPEDVAEKIFKSGCDKEVLIVGETFPLSADHFCGDNTAFGWLAHSSDEPCGGMTNWWAPAALGRWMDGKGQIGFCHSEGGFNDRISGGYDGGCFGELKGASSIARKAWAEACNTVRWEANR